MCVYDSSYTLHITHEMLYGLNRVDRKAVRATLVLMPLLGLSYVILITNPGNSYISKQVFGYFNSVLQSTQV